MYRRISLLVVILLLFNSICFGGETGKLVGKITDAETGDPLFGANIIIDGTQLGAAADNEGDYFIINIPPGTYSVTASMVGYQKVNVKDVVITIDRTTTINFQLSTTSILGEEVVIVAEKNAVKRDVSQTEINATNKQIDVIPNVKDINQFIQLQAGVQFNEAGEMLIRGGGMDQVGMVVDGLTMRNNISGAPINIVNLSAIKEVSIIKGGFNAEYGNIRSGLFNIVTKDASKTYSGSVDLRFTPAQLKHRGASLYDWNNYWVRPYVDPSVCWVGTQNGSWDQYTQGQYRAFEGWNKFTERLNNDEDPTNDLTPEQARDLYLWQHQLKGSGALGHPHEGNYGDKPDWNIDASLGGPLPVISDALGNLRFFASYRYQQEQYTYPQQLDAVLNNNFMIKINSDISTSLKLGFEYLYGEENNAGGESGEIGSITERGAYFPYATSPEDIYTRVYGFTLDHVLSNNTFYKLRLSYINIKHNADGARTLRNTNILRSFGSYNVDEQPYGFLNSPGYLYAIADEMVIGGVGGDWINKDRINTLNIKFDIVSQFDKYNQVQAGIELINDDYDILEQVDGFDPTGNFLNQWNKTPLRLQSYIQDKLEFESFIANIGLRVDYSNPNSLWYGVDSYSMYFSRVFKDQLLNEAPSEDAKYHLTFSPRVGVAFPITVNSKLYFNYGHFYDMPDAFNMYQINYGIPSQGISQLGNPNLKPRRTIAYELGYEHEVADMFLLRVIGYYKDVSNEIGSVEYVNYDESVDYATFSNDHYADIRGFEIELRKDIGDWVSGWVNYTLMVQTDGLVGREVQYQDPRKQIVYGLRNPVVEKPLPRPYANANIRFMSPVGWGPALGNFHVLDQVSLNFLVTWQTGSYLTWEPLPPFQEENNLQWKDRWNVDMRISKAFQISTFEFNLFVDVINLFDLEYLTGLGFADNADFRDYMNSLHLPLYGQAKYKNDSRFTAGNDKVGDVRSEDKPYINMPNLDFVAWNPPRSIVLGLRVGF